MTAVYQLQVESDRTATDETDSAWMHKMETVVASQVEGNMGEPDGD